MGAQAGAQGFRVEPGSIVSGPTSLVSQVNHALNRVVDPCSVGRGVPAGLVDMGMVKSVEVLHDTGGHRARVTLRITSPGCHLQMWFTQRVTDEITALPDIAGVDVLWSDVFDWSDDDMSDSLKSRLRAKKRVALAAHQRSLA